MNRLLFEIDLQQENTNDEQKQKIKMANQGKINYQNNNKNNQIKNTLKVNIDENQLAKQNIIIQNNKNKDEQLNDRQKYKQQIKNKRYQKKISIQSDDDNQIQNYNKYTCDNSYNLSRLQSKSNILSPNQTIFQKYSKINQNQFLSNQKAVQKQLSTRKTSLKCQTSKIWQLNEKVAPETISLSLKQTSLLNPLQIRNFLMNPIPKGKVFQFSIKKKQRLISTQYLLCFQYQNQCKYIACATSNSISFDKCIFTLSLKIQNNIQQQLDNIRTNRFIGLFVSNFNRTTFTLYDHFNYNNICQNVKILCTVSTVPNLMETALRKNDLYIPKIQNNRKKTIYNSTISNNLKKLYNIPETKNQISKLASYMILTQELEKLGKQFSIKKNTTRNAVIKDDQKVPKFLIVKIESNCFKLRAYETVAPIQIFSYAIVHLQ